MRLDPELVSAALPWLVVIVLLLAVCVLLWPVRKGP